MVLLVCARSCVYCWVCVIGLFCYACNSVVLLLFFDFCFSFVNVYWLCLFDSLWCFDVCLGFLFVWVLLMDLLVFGFSFGCLF